MAIIKIENLSKKYPTRYALKDVSFEIANGEFTVITGMKECGKTTLLRAICGLDSIEKGEAYVDGILINKLEPKDRDMAVISTSIPLDLNNSVYDNLAKGLKLRKYPKEEIESRVNKAANLLGLEDYLRRLTKNLTPGQKLRAMLARAISREPKIILVDDILKGCDPGLKRELITEIIKLNKRLKTNFIYATSNPYEALTMADKIVFLEEGIVTQIGTPTELYSRPNTLPIATFFGQPKINLFQGILVEGENKKYYFETNGWKILIEKELSSEVVNRYLDGKKTMTLAFRAEDLSIDENGEITAIIDQCDKISEEKFCAYLYSPLVEKANDFNAFISGELESEIKLALNKDKALFYDTQTEMLLF